MSNLRVIQLVGGIFVVAGCAATTSCTVKTSATRDLSNIIEVSVPEQKLALYRDGKLIRKYPISTSKFGLGDEKGSYKTPIGKMEVAEKVGGGKPAGAVFKHREWTGEVVRPNSPGRDPIVSRILWLNGLESRNQNAYSRCIYIHGTAAEKEVGNPVSYGCVRMKSKDVIDLYQNVGEGAYVQITRKKIVADQKEMGNPVPLDEPIRAIPMMEAHVPATMQPVDPLATRPVWNQVGNFQASAEDILVKKEGFNAAYLNIPDPPEVR